MAYLSRYLLLLLLLAPRLPAGVRGSNVHFQHLNVEDGLSQGSVICILQDHQGFMWIGTPDGLNRYDGIEFHIYRNDPRDSRSLSGNLITCLFEDSDSVLWVGTEHGLDRFDRGRDCFDRLPIVRPESSASQDYLVKCVGESHSGGARRLWSIGLEIYSVDPKRGELSALAIPPVSARQVPGGILRVWADHKGSLWLGCSAGMCRLDPETGSIDNVWLRGPDISALLFPKWGRDTVVWLGGSAGLFSRDLVTGRAAKLDGTILGTLCEGANGEIWAGTDGAGLRRYSPGGVLVDSFRHDESAASSLASDFVQCQCMDAAGALWVGTVNGLDRYDEAAPAFITYRHRPGDPATLGDDFVLPIIEDRSGNIWCGTIGHGVSILQASDPGHFIRLKNAGGHGRGPWGDNVRALLQDRTGGMWIATGEGLTLRETPTSPGRRVPVPPLGGSLAYWVESLCESREGAVWAGRPGLGILKIERAGDRASGGFRLTTFRLQDRALEDPHDVSVILEDRSGIVWVGTDHGLFRVDPKTGGHRRYVHRSGDSTSMSNDAVWSILEDTAAGAPLLWIGTSDGLDKFDVRAGTFHGLPAQNGFPSACVYGMLRDSSGRLWLSTNLGVTRFDERLPEGRKFKNYDVSDGLAGNEFNRRSCCRLRDGEFLFGGTHGITRFDPMRFRENPVIPPVVLTGFSTFGRKVRFDRDLDHLGGITLRHEEDVFSFEFAALNYTNARRNQYEYMMEGFDKEWVRGGTRRDAYYTHLDPGSYTFRVRASNNDGLWNTEGARIAVVITPPFWGTWWFRALSGLVVVAALTLVYRRRIAGLEKEKRVQQDFSLRLLGSQEVERKRIAGELHDSLGQDLLVIRNRALLGLKGPSLSQDARDQLDQISTVSTRAIEEVREIAYDLRPYQLDRLGLNKAIESIVAGFASSVHFTVEADAVDREVAEEAAIHVFRIVQEGVNNIIKHSGASEARVEIRVREHAISIRISDNGRGLPGDVPRSGGLGGFGLTGMAERAKVLNGTLKIESAPGSGTTLTVSIPRRSGST